MNRASYSFRRVRMTGAFLSLAICLMLPGTSRAQVKLYLSDQPAGGEAIPEPKLRPNVAQDLYLFVEGTNGQKSKVTVQVMAGDKPIDGAVKEIELTGKGPQRVEFPPAKPAEKGAKPVPPPEVAGTLHVVALNEEKQKLYDMEIKTGRPSEFVETKVDPLKPDWTRLSLTVSATKEFFGPRSRVELDLRPERLPFLSPKQKLVGSYGGYVTREKRLKLAADSLAMSQSRESGLFYVTVDGYQRAFTYRISPEGGEPTALEDAAIRLTADPTAASGPAAKVGIEADHLPPGSEIQLGLYRDSEHKDLDGELLTFKGDRQVRLFFNPAGPGGALTFKPEVSDWTTGLETAKIFGKRFLRLQLVDENKKPITFTEIDSRGQIKRGVNEIASNLKLVGSPPEDVGFVDLPKELARGSTLTLKATGRDPDSDISKVVFFTGKLPPDGVIPPTAVQAPGEKAKEKDKDGREIWSAVLPVATDKIGTIEVSVQFTNGVGLIETSKPAVIKIVDAKPGAATIKGAVVEGEQAQEGLEVLLRDPQGMVKDTAKTDKDGKFAFKNVAPGMYQLVVVKSSSMRTGTAVVKVEAGEEKELKEAIKLMR